MNQKADTPARNALARDFSFLSLLKFAAPSILTMILMGLYTVSDVALVSRFVNTDALSAVNIVCPVINFTVGFASMLATGGSAVIARHMGAGNEKKARQNFTFLVLTALCSGFLIVLAGLMFSAPLLRTLGASSTLIPYCRDYLLILLLFTPAAILQVLYQNLIVTAGCPGLGMMLSFGAGAVNLICDYFFMAYCNMGIAGAALGTGIGYLIPTIAGTIFFSITKGILRFEKPLPDLVMLAESCLNGSSEMVSQLSAAVTTILFNLTMMKLAGENGVAAITILIYSQFMMTALYIGFSMGVAPVISYRFGAGNKSSLNKIFRICFLTIAASSLTTFGLSLFASSFLVSLFTMPGTSVYRLAEQGFGIFLYSFLFSGINIFSSAAFTALSNGKISAVISFLRTFGFITASLFILPRYAGITGVWLAVPAAELLTCSLSAFFIVRYRKTYSFL